jgi:hypothetical protein
VTPEHVLEQWLSGRLPNDAATWLKNGAQRLRRGGNDKDLYMSVSLVPRKIGKADLALTATELAQAAVSRPGWDPVDWSLDQAARIYLLLAAGPDGEILARRLDQLCATADVGELVAFYRGLPFYPDPPRHVRAAEGVRSNMKAVFEAVAHRNSFPGCGILRMAGGERGGAARIRARCHGAHDPALRRAAYAPDRAWRRSVRKRQRAPARLRALVGAQAGGAHRARTAAR